LALLVPLCASGRSILRFPATSWYSRASTGVRDATIPHDEIVERFRVFFGAALFAGGSGRTYWFLRIRAICFQLSLKASKHGLPLSGIANLKAKTDSRFEEAVDSAGEEIFLRL
jgi:hypothetical protein